MVGLEVKLLSYFPMYSIMRVNALNTKKDLDLTEEEIIALYGRRWSIEVFFKVCKCYLNLGKEFQGISYDSMTAHTAIVMARYMMLAVENRNNQDARTMGELFLCCEV